MNASSPKLGLILVTRGGGSLEDLWAFNEEILARAIFNSALPVVSAVGHEIDYTISDFVADLRAATPSAAAEIITEGVFGTRQFIAQVIPEMSQRAWQRLRRERDGLMLPSRRLARLHPRRRLNEKLQQLDDLLTDLNRTLKHRRRECQSLWQSLHQRLVLARPAQRLLRRREIWLAAHRRLSDLARPRLKRWQERLLNLESRLGLLSPEQVLARGYSITLDPATGAVIRRAAQVRSGQKLITRLQSGEVQSTAD